MRKYRLTRPVTQGECPWLHYTHPRGETVYECVLGTYGCISPEGEAVTLDPNGGYPFFELPLNAIEEVRGEN